MSKYDAVTVRRSILESTRVLPASAQDGLSSDLKGRIIWGTEGGTERRRSSAEENAALQVPAPGPMWFSSMSQSQRGDSDGRKYTLSLKQHCLRWGRGCVQRRRRRELCSRTTADDVTASLGSLLFSSGSEAVLVVLRGM